MSDWKTTCPSCDSWTSSIGQAAHDGEPCPYCGASLPPFAPWDEHCAQCQFLVARDAARGIATELEQQLAAIVSLRACLGAGPMDYELFVDELDELIRPVGGGLGV